MNWKVLIVAVLAGFAAQGFAADKMLADRHMERVGKCEACHATMPPKPIATNECLKCHQSYEAVAKRTESKDINPHDSHLENPACTSCHRGHKKPVLVCDECHEFRELKVP
jgi:fumarate reductase flavoprotein subunit